MSLKVEEKNHLMKLLSFLETEVGDFPKFKRVDW